jgi:hypothetical protein
MEMPALLALMWGKKSTIHPHRHHRRQITDETIGHHFRRRDDRFALR